MTPVCVCVASSVDQHGSGSLTAATILEVNPDVHLLVASMFDSSGSPDWDRAANCVEWAIGCGADIVVFVAGSIEPKHTLYQRILKMSSRVLFVAPTVPN